jgi:hypothetical protein
MFRFHHRDAEFAEVLMAFLGVLCDSAVINPPVRWKF